jgi:hypothetical protein
LCCGPGARSLIIFGKSKKKRRDDLSISLMPLFATTRSGDVCPSPKFTGVFSALRPTPVFDTYWRFAAERQAIFFRRIRGAEWPLTDDPVLAKHKFTNTYRASDRVSQFLIRDVIYEPAFSRGAEDVLFRILLFKLFNKIETWQLLLRHIGEPSWGTFDIDELDRVLSAAKQHGDSIYSAAYIMPSGRSSFGYTRKHRNHLELIDLAIRSRLHDQIAECRSLSNVFYLLRNLPSLGNFLAYQLAIDINYSEITSFSEMDFVMPGPGARDGIRKCFSDLGGFSEADIIRLMTDRQEMEFERLGLDFRDLWGRRLHLIDCQNLFCEVDKYARVVHPEIEGVSGRSRIKQIYRPGRDPIAYFYPPKWNLNLQVGAL